MTAKWQLPSDNDPSIVLREYQERLATLENPRHRAMLETLIEHIRTVLVGDLEGVMATMADDSAFKMWTPAGDVGKKGTEEVRRRYAEGFAHGGGSIRNQINKLENFVVDDNTIVLEMTESRVLPGRVARDRGYDVPDDGNYAVYRHCAVIIPFDEKARIRGEYNYGMGYPPAPNDWDRIPDGDLSPEYRAWLKALDEQAAAQRQGS